MKRLTQEQFIEKAKEAFPQYDYSMVHYENCKKNVDIICHIHGVFSVRPDCLLNGTGCPYCGGTKKLDTETFIKKANFVHNNFFSYEHCVYKSSNEKVIVTCPIHGDFEVKANNHLNGCNCKKCQKEKIHHKTTKLQKVNSSTRKLTTEEFIKKAKEKWGEKYSYEKVNYVRSNEKITVTCPIHGEFFITPNHFLNNRGCPECGRNKHLTTEEFIKKARKIHGNKYCYDKTIYNKTHNNIIITCPIHGDFYQTPANHLRGQGCPVCNQSHLEEEIAIFLDSNNIKYEREKKFSWLEGLSLDFYLYEYNVAIECQGIQHFEPVEYYGGEKAFKKQLERDNRKKECCDNNNVNLIFYANYKYNFPYEVITNKKKLLENIKK